jgi:Ca2+-binding EF-hand superfamily protein
MFTPFKDGNGVISKKEFADIVNLDPDCEKATYMFNSLDVNRDGQLNYKEFLVVAAHFNSSLDDLSKSRFCFKMVDADNDGVVTYAELRTFLVDVLYSNSSAKHRMASKVDDLISNKLGVNTYDTLKEQDFAGAQEDAL